MRAQVQVESLKGREADPWIWDLYKQADIGVYDIDFYLDDELIVSKGKIIPTELQ